MVEGMSHSPCGYVRHKNKKAPHPRRSIICPLYHEHRRKYLRWWTAPRAFAFSPLAAQVAVLGFISRAAAVRIILEADQFLVASIGSRAGLCSAASWSS